MAYFMNTTVYRYCHDQPNKRNPMLPDNMPEIHSDWTLTLPWINI